MTRFFFSVIFLWFIVSCKAQTDLTPKMSYEVKAEQFTVDYDTLNKIPITVYYTIIKDLNTGYGRYSFHKKLCNKTAESSDYTYSGYDRGHMYPAGSTISYTSCYESFDMVNILPQLPRFNRGIWSQIESFEQSNCDPYCYVICGVVPIKSKNYIKNKIRIPDQFYKIIYNPSKNAMIGFLVSMNSTGDIKSYAKTVDEIESIIGLDIFYQLPTALQKIYESKIDFNLWNW